LSREASLAALPRQRSEPRRAASAAKRASPRCLGRAHGPGPRSAAERRAWGRRLGARPGGGPPLSGPTVLVQCPQTRTAKRRGPRGPPRGAPGRAGGYGTGAADAAGPLSAAERRGGPRSATEVAMTQRAAESSPLGARACSAARAAHIF